MTGASYMNLNHVKFYLDNFQDIALMKSLDQRTRIDIPIYVARFIASELREAFLKDDQLSIDYFEQDDENLYWADRRFYDEDNDTGLYFGLGKLSAQTILEDPTRKYAPIVYTYLEDSGRKKKIINLADLRGSIEVARLALIRKGYKLNLTYEGDTYPCARMLDEAFTIACLREPHIFSSRIINAAMELTRDVLKLL